MPHDVAVITAVNKTGLLFFFQLSILWLADAHELKAAFNQHEEVAQVDVSLHYEEFFFVVRFAQAAPHHFVQVALVKRGEASRLQNDGAHFGELLFGRKLLLSRGRTVV